MYSLAARADLRSVSHPGVIRIIKSIIEKAVSALIHWLTENVGCDQSVRVTSDSVVVALVRLVFARGVPALFSSWVPCRPPASHYHKLVSELELSDVRGFEQAAQAAFKTEPGSTEDLIERWTVR